MEEREQKFIIEDEKSVVSFFDLLARFDFEDKQKESLEHKGLQNRKEISAVRTSEKTCSAKLKE